MAKIKSAPKLETEEAAAVGSGISIGVGTGCGPGSILGLSPGFCRLAACIAILLVICCCFGWFNGTGTCV